MKPRKIGRVKSRRPDRAKARRTARLISAVHEGESCEGQYCKEPDVDVPGTECGHPLPCPRHTLLIDIDRKPPILIVPVTATDLLEDSGRLAAIARAVREECER